MKQIYTLRVECLSVEEECIRTIEIEEDDTLYSLHFAIQKAVDFDNDHLFDFYLGRTWRNSIQPITSNDAWEESIDDFADITINEVYPAKNKKLYYLFDFGDCWRFEIRKKRGTKDADKKVRYPRVVESIGPNPVQYPDCDYE